LATERLTDATVEVEQAVAGREWSAVMAAAAATSTRERRLATAKWKRQAPREPRGTAESDLMGQLHPTYSAPRRDGVDLDRTVLLLADLNADRRRPDAADAHIE
jgi:hypothetical protein